ncbi:unnamed protein product [Lepidochelys kempii]
MARQTISIPRCGPLAKKFAHPGSVGNNQTLEAPPEAKKQISRRRQISVCSVPRNELPPNTHAGSNQDPTGPWRGGGGSRHRRVPRPGGSVRGEPPPCPGSSAGSPWCSEPRTRPLAGARHMGSAPVVGGGSGLEWGSRQGSSAEL